MSMQPKSSDPQVQQQQKMMKIMPIMFGFIFYQMPSGLVLYFTTSSCYTVVEHYLIKRRLHGEDDLAEAATHSGPAAPSAPAGQGIRKAADEGKGGGKGKKKKKKR
jgi:YidC/Oxa1 family membrane protein insertase